MTLTIFYLLSLLVLTALGFMLFARSLRFILLGWLLVSLVLAVFFFLLHCPLIAVLQVLFTVCLGVSLQTATKHNPQPEKRSINRSIILNISVMALLSLIIAGLIFRRLWFSPHTPFPPANDVSQMMDKLLTGQPVLLISCATLLILAGLVTLVVLAHKEKP